MSLADFPRIRLQLLQIRRQRCHLPQPDGSTQPKGLWVSRRGGGAESSIPFTTSYHTRFPEYVRLRAPIQSVLRLLRWFHGPAHRMLVATQSKRMSCYPAGLKISVAGLGESTRIIRTTVNTNDRAANPALRRTSGA